MQLKNNWRYIVKSALSKDLLLLLFTTKKPFCLDKLYCSS